MTEMVIVLLLLGGVALLFSMGALIGHLLGLGKKMEEMQHERRRSSARNQQGNISKR
ncbi:hypothetical protein [uncultured Acetobacteroides sp.]|uniref:hypothetical protein n=1 Tax=uncultured Acetobacteroides sp. TaxID=1760811 RepID=UPI0029F4D30E|nr:hypothetical protein [uncultured Acetobacteroides sp.]